MRKSSKKVWCVLSLIALGFVGISSCKKKERIVLGTTQNLQEFIDKYSHKKEVQEFNISELPKTFSFANGSKINLPAGALNVSGSLITGVAKLEILELFKRSAIIFSGQSTNYNSGEPLTSQKMIYWNVKSNGTEISQSLSKAAVITLPATTSDTQAILQNSSSTENESWEWDEQNSNVFNPVMVQPAGQLYTFGRPRLGWINIGLLFSYGTPKSTLQVKLIDNPGTVANAFGKAGDILVYFCPKGVNVASRLLATNDPNIVRNMGASMPVGIKGKLIAFGAKGGQYYIAQKEITTANMMETSLELIRTTEDEIVEQIKLLDSY